MRTFSKENEQFFVEYKGGYYPLEKALLLGIIYSFEARILVDHYNRNYIGSPTVYTKIEPFFAHLAKQLSSKQSDKPSDDTLFQTMIQQLKDEDLSDYIKLSHKGFETISSFIYDIFTFYRGIQNHNGQSWTEAEARQEKLHQDTDSINTELEGLFKVYKRSVAISTLNQLYSMENKICAYIKEFYPESKSLKEGETIIEDQLNALIVLSNTMALKLMDIKTELEANQLNTKKEALSKINQDNKQVTKQDNEKPKVINKESTKVITYGFIIDYTKVDAKESNEVTNGVGNNLSNQNPKIDSCRTQTPSMLTLALMQKTPKDGKSPATSSTRNLNSGA